MATRLYATPGVFAAVSPTFYPSWYWTQGAVRRPLSQTKTNAGDDYLSVVTDTFITNLLVLHWQLVSGPIAAGPISGTFSGQFYALDLNNYAMRSQVYIRVVSNDGSTFRGTLFGGDNDGTFYQGWSASNYLNRKFPRAHPVALSSVTAQANDRIVVEIGGLVASAQPSNGYTVISDTTLGDLPVGDTTDAAPGLATWVEFSDNLFTLRMEPILRTYILE